MIRIKEFRLKQNMKQKELSSILKVPANTLSVWESGKFEPPYEKLIEIADYFNVSTDYLLGRDSPGTNTV